MSCFRFFWATIFKLNFFQCNSCPKIFALKEIFIYSIFISVYPPERERERERERSVYLHQTFSINYRLKHTKKRFYILKLNKLIISHIRISNQRALLRYDAAVGRDKSHLITTPMTDSITTHH